MKYTIMMIALVCFLFGILYSDIDEPVCAEPYIFTTVHAAYISGFIALCFTSGFLAGREHPKQD